MEIFLFYSGILNKSLITRTPMVDRLISFQQFRHLDLGVALIDYLDVHFYPFVITSLLFLFPNIFYLGKVSQY